MTFRGDDTHNGQAASAACSGVFEWSAFGADYPDTECVNGWLRDLDADNGGFQDIPCPFCHPEDFTEYLVDGNFSAPACRRCDKPLPSRTPITYHDGRPLGASATCPVCGPTSVTFREYDEDFPQWQTAVSGKATREVRGSSTR